MKNILKEIRRKYDLTQGQLAERLSIKRGAVAQIETGRNNITSALAQKINTEFGYSMDFILNYKGEDLRLVDIDEYGKNNAVLGNINEIELELDKFKMLKRVFDEFVKEKDLKGVTPHFDTFNKQNNYTQMIDAFEKSLLNQTLDYKFEKEFKIKTKHAIENLFEDLYTNMSFAYNILSEYYK